VTAAAEVAGALTSLLSCPPSSRTATADLRAVAAAAGRNARHRAPASAPSRVRPHVVGERYIPHTPLVPVCDAVVFHGGSGSARAALAMSSPQLCLLQAAHQFLNAPAAARAAGGLAIYVDEVDAADVAPGTQRLLEDSCYRKTRRRLAEQTGCMPSDDEVALVL